MNFDRKKFHEQVYVVTSALAIVALPYSIPACHFGLILLSLNWIIEGQWNRKWEIIKKEYILLPYILFFVMHLIGLLYTEDKVNGVYNIEKKYALFFLPFVFSTMSLSYKQISFLLRSFITTCFIASIICISNSAYNFAKGGVSKNFDLDSSHQFELLNPGASYWPYFSYQELSSGINIHPTYLGIYILFCIVIIITNYKVDTLKWKKGILIILFFYFSIFLMMLSARVVIIGYSIICPVCLWWHFKDKRGEKITVFASVFIILTSSLLTFINPINRYRSVQEFIQSPIHFNQNEQPKKTSSEIRLSLWWTGMHTITKNNWLIGEGTGDVKEAMRVTSEKYKITNTINSYDPHNQFIYTAISMGVLGLLLLIMCMFIPLISMPQEKPILLLSACLISIVFLTSLTESFFELQKGIAFFAIFNSVLLFQPRIQKVQVN